MCERVVLLDGGAEIGIDGEKMLVGFVEFLRS